MARAARKRYESPLRRAQARSTRLLVLEAARRLFAERGYVATSVDEIARAAGVGRATVFASVGAAVGSVLAAGQTPNLLIILSPPILLPLLGLAALALVPLAWRRWRAADA